MYDQRNSYPVFNPCLLHDMQAKRQHPKEEAPLSEKERQLQALLKTVSSKSIIGFCIKEALNSGTNRDTRQLIAELKEQARQAEKGLREALGNELVNMIIAL